MEEHIKKAIKVLKQGGVVIYPTDTAFGIGCRIDDARAVEKVFSIRKRPVTQATPILIDSLDMAKQYAKAIPEDVIETLIKPYWPGALTIVLPCQIEKVPGLVRGGGLTIGLRVPNHETTLALINGLQIPLLGPSANFHGDPTPYQFVDINPELYHLVDYIVPGVCSVKLVSTVVDCTENPWKVLRQGAVKL